MGAHRLRGSKPLLPLAAVAAVLAVAQPARADNTTSFVMKISLATVNDAQHEWSKRFAASVEKDSGGRIKGEIYPTSQLGAIPRQIEGVQFGSIQIYVGPPEFMVGVDPRFEVVSAPGQIENIEHGARTAETPSVQQMMLGLGADKGLHGVALFVSQPSSVITRQPVRTLADFKGKKLRVLAAQMQEDSMSRLGATPIAMSLGDVLPAIQQGTIDGALAAITIDTTMKYDGAAKFVTEAPGLPFIFSLAVMSSKWYDALPKDLQAVVDKDGPEIAKSVDLWELDFYKAAHEDWKRRGGELIALPPNEQQTLLQTLASVGSDLSQKKPAIKDDFDTFVAAAKAAK